MSLCPCVLSDECQARSIISTDWHSDSHFAAVRQNPFIWKRCIFQQLKKEWLVLTDSCGFLNRLQGNKGGKKLTWCISDELIVQVRKRREVPQIAVNGFGLTTICSPATVISTECGAFRWTALFYLLTECSDYSVMGNFIVWNKGAFAFLNSVSLCAAHLPSSWGNSWQKTATDVLMPPVMFALKAAPRNTPLQKVKKKSWWPNLSF